MNTDTRDPLRLIQSGLEKLGHSPGAIDGLWGLRTARAMKALLAANGRAASVAPPGPLPWITEAKSALGRHEARDRSWLMDWLKRDGRSLGDPSKNPWCGDFVETCIRLALPDEPLLEALGKERPVTDAAIEVAVGGQSARTALREVMDTETRWRVRAQRALGLTSGECFLLVDGVIVEGHMTPVRVPDALLAVPLPAYPAHVPQTAPALAVADEVLV